MNIDLKDFLITLGSWDSKQFCNMDVLFYQMYVLNV